MPQAKRKAVVKAAPKKRIKAAHVVHRPTPKDHDTTERKRATVHETARLEARVPAELYEIMKRAAELRGVSLTSYVIDSVGEQAQKDIEQITLIRLALPDQIRFAEALLNSPAPNERLKSAFALRAALIEPR